MTLTLVSSRRNARLRAPTSIIFTIENQYLLVQMAPQASWPSSMPLGLKNHCLGFRAGVMLCLAASTSCANSNQLPQLPRCTNIRVEPLCFVSIQNGPFSISDTVFPYTDTDTVIRIPSSLAASPSCPCRCQHLHCRCQHLLHCPCLQHDQSQSEKN